MTYRQSGAFIGAICSILAGVIFFCSGILFFVAQVGRFDWDSLRSISNYLNRTPPALLLWGVVNWGAAIASLLALAGVLALAERLRPNGWIEWARVLAILGYAIIAVTNVADFYQIQRLARHFPDLDPAAQAALEALGTGSLDPMLNLRFITLGPWFAIVGWVGLHSDQLPRPLASLGIIAGLFALVFVVTTWLTLQSFVLIAGALAVIFHPLWLIWTGIMLWQRR